MPYQATTDRLDNVKVENGVLKITAKKESYGGKEYTSGRIRTYTKLDFWHFQKGKQGGRQKRDNRQST